MTSTQQLQGVPEILKAEEAAEQNVQNALAKLLDERTALERKQEEELRTAESKEQTAGDKEVEKTEKEEVPNITKQGKDQCASALKDIDTQATKTAPSVVQGLVQRLTSSSYLS